ncbi:hypothetical protein O3P69_015063 [Scylla paramamosain]|uniref:Uncharacterized protein n=1 Tax=Scylla paramamosain TaxID=85552 RepID=A0AAW0T288_SCYPA
MSRACWRAVGKRSGQNGQREARPLRCGADRAATQFSSARPAMERGGCVGCQHVSLLLPLCCSFRAAKYWKEWIYVHDLLTIRN